MDVENSYVHNGPNAVQVQRQVFAIGGCQVLQLLMCCSQRKEKWKEASWGVEIRLPEVIENFRCLQITKSPIPIPVLVQSLGCLQNRQVDNEISGTLSDLWKLRWREIGHL